MSAQVIQQAFQKLNPGGWLESQEFDIVLRCDDGTAPADHGMRLVSNSPTEGDVSLPRLSHARLNVSSEQLKRA